MAEKDKKKAAGSPTAYKISKKKLWAFRIISLLILPLIFLALLEIILRLSNTGYETGAIIEREVNEQKLCYNNLKFSWRFFPRNVARDLRPFVFEKQKSQDTYRIFVLGASAARGTP
ncbi:MAG: hypothetical protein WC374_06830, partial [Phycisphaerae bacterium]